MAIGSTSPFDHNVFAAASGLTSSPWAKQPNHSYIHKAETRTFSAATSGEPTKATCKWTSVHRTGGGVKAPKTANWMSLTSGPKNSKYYTYTSYDGNGYLKLHEITTKKSAYARLVPANNYKIMGAIRFPEGVKSWKGNITGADGQYARKSSDGKEIVFSILGAGSKIEVDVDSEHSGYGNSVTIDDNNTSRNSGWSKPDQDVQIKIWNVYRCDHTQCPSGYTLGSDKRCRTKQCRDNKFMEYVSYSAISDNTKCKICKSSGTAASTSGTGWSVDSKCKVTIKPGYIWDQNKQAKHGVKSTGCTSPNFNETGSFQVPNNTSKYCKTCVSTHHLKNGKCVRKGCTDVNASNYNSSAEHDDGTCTCGAGYAMDANKCVVSGCMDPTDSGYNSSAKHDNPNLCTGQCATGYEKNDAGNCIAIVKTGCTDSEADNYDSEAGADDGSCSYSCADGNRVTTDKGTCGDTCNDGYSLVDGVCEEIVEVPDEPALEEENGDTTVDTTVTTQTTGAVVTATTTPKSKTGLIIGGVAVVGLLGFMMMRKKAPAAAEWYGY